MEIMSISLTQYLNAMRGKEESPLSLNVLLSPFGLGYQADPDEGLLIGWVLEQLAVEFKPEDFIDPMDVASTALGFGYEPADRFLSDAPWLMLSAATQQQRYMALLCNPSQRST